MSDSFSIPPAHRQALREQLHQAAEQAFAGRTLEATECFLAAIQCDTGQTARLQFGAFLAHTDCLLGACEQFETALAAARRTNDLPAQVTACHNLAVVYRQLGRDAEAASLQQLSLQGEMKLGESRDGDASIAGLACDLSSRACDAINDGDLPLAEALLRRALAIEEDRGNVAGQAADWGNLAIVCGLRGRLEQSFECLWQAFRLHRQIHDFRGAGSDLLNLAEMYRQEGDWDNAAHAARSAIEQFRRAGAPKMLARAEAIERDLRRVATVRHRDPLCN